MSVWPTPRTFAGAIKRRLFPTPAVAAWRLIETRAEREPRYTAGQLSLLDLEVEYVDAATLAPQWHDIFVRQTLEFRAAHEAPRVLDCGANVGLASLWLKRRFPAARITAFEADTGISDVLQRNLARNGAGDVEVIRAAVWREEGTLAFRSEGSDSGAIDQVAADTPGTIVQVPAVRLRRWLDAPVDLLKLDIEGAELEVLEDVADLLDHVKALHVEVHDFQPDRRLLPRCLQVMERAGFTYALDDLAAAGRRSGRPPGPFARAIPSWVILVRAWRSGAAVS